MKKLIAILVVMITMINYISFAQDAEEENVADQASVGKDHPIDYKQTLIDFTQIDPELDENLSIAYGNELALTLPPEEVETLPPINYGLKNWRLVPASSIKRTEVFKASRVQSVVVQAGEYAGQHVLGVKIKFPSYNYDMFVNIEPPFMPDTSNPAFNNNGVLDNVGIVRSAYITVYGLYQPEKLYLVTEDDDGATHEFGFGSLYYIGWRTLEWINPDYIYDVRDREIDRRPLYPRASSKRRFKSIIIQRSALNGTTDFVTYIKDVALTYDKAINNDLFNDIANEETWRIIEDSYSQRERLMIKKAATDRYFEYLEERKLYFKNEAVESGIATSDGGGQ